MRFTLEIELGNDAMRSFQDLRDALKRTITQLGSSRYCLKARPSDGDGTRIMDENGNAVGKWEISETPAESAEDDADYDDGEEDVQGLCSETEDGEANDPPASTTPAVWYSALSEDSLQTIVRPYGCISYGLAPAYAALPEAARKAVNRCHENFGTIINRS